MNIVSSSFVVGTKQVDGRSYVEEAHQTDNGEVIRVEYGPVGKVNYQAIANARGADMTVQTGITALADEKRTVTAAKVAAVFASAVKAGSLTVDEVAL